MSTKYEYIVVADSIAELAAVDGFKTNQLALVKQTDGSQALYFWDITSSGTIDSDLIVGVAGSAFGRWIRFLPTFEKVGGALATAPASGTVSVVHKSIGAVIQSTFTLTLARIPVTDAAGSGSYGTLNLYDFPEGAIQFLGSRMDQTACAEGAALTGAVGDAVYEIGLGTVAIAVAADGVLAALNDDIGGDINITNSGGTGAGAAVTAGGLAHDGTTTAPTLNLNWSGTAATIDANSEIDITATITVLWAMMGDD